MFQSKKKSLQTRPVINFPLVLLNVGSNSNHDESNDIVKISKDNLICLYTSFFYNNSTYFNF